MTTLNKDYRNNILSLMQAKAKSAVRGNKVALLNKDDLTDENNKVCYFDQYRQRLDRYCLTLYNSLYRGQTVSNEDLDKALACVLEMLLPSDTVESLIKTFGSHRQLVSARFGRQLTEKAKAKIKALRAKIKSVEDSDKLSDTERLEQIEQLEDKIKAVRDGNNYELPLYSNINQTTFRRQFESFVIYKLNELEIARTYNSLDITGSKKWVSTIEKVLTYDGVDKVKVEAFKQACDFDGLKAYKKSLETAYKAKKLAAVEPPKAKAKKAATKK